MRRILSALLPGWPIRRWQRNNLLAEGPFATVETHQGQRRIVACCTRAQAAGVASGQALAQARAICPTLAVVEADPAADHAGLQRMAIWCERYTPLAAANKPDGLWLDITGCTHLTDGEEALAATLVQRLAPARIAIAGTPGAAWALARAATRPSVQVLKPGDERAALSALPVALLRLDARVVAGLRRVGLRSIGELARQPRADLTARFGATPGLRLDQAYGTAAEAIAWPRPPVPWSEFCGFVEPIGTQDDLSRALVMLAGRLCARLEAGGLGGLQFSACFHCVDARRPEIAIGFARPARDPARVAQLLATKLETVDPGFGVEAVILVAGTVAPLTLGQTEMGKRTPQSESLVAVVDDLSNRLEPDRLSRPAPQASHIPERAAIKAPPLSAIAVWLHPPGERPLRLLRPPEPIEATAPVPDDPPVLFRWRGALHRVRAASGPERIAAEWWRRSPEPYRFRDYYRVEDTLGARFWLFRTGLPDALQPPGWFLHGLFG